MKTTRTQDMADKLIQFFNTPRFPGDYETLMFLRDPQGRICHIERVIHHHIVECAKIDILTIQIVDAAKDLAAGYLAGE